VSLIEERILPANSVFQSKNAKITRFWTRVSYAAYNDEEFKKYTKSAVYYFSKKNKIGRIKKYIPTEYCKALKSKNY